MTLEQAALPRIDEIPFDSDTASWRTLHARATTARLRIFVKGAPERVLALCALQR